MTAEIAGQTAMALTDERLPPWASVTEVVKATVNPLHPDDWLLRWAWRQGRNGVALNDGRATGRDRGRAVHKALEDAFAGRPIQPGAYESEVRPFIDGLCAWMRETDPVLTHVEVSAEDPQLRVRGRIDVVRACPGCAVCENAEMPGAVLLDCKTGGLDPGRGDHVQVGGGYRHLYAVNAKRTVPCSAEILALDPSGKHRVVEAAAGTQTFMSALTWFRDLTRLPG